jgi:cysteine desulfurase / selenocysteine lyase
LEIASVSSQFPILSRVIDGKRLVYLDNSATTQKPKRVIDAIVDFYQQHNANIHRGIHTLSNEASEMYEHSHVRASDLINASGIEEIVFTRNTTESINLLANAWGKKNLKKGDVVITTEMEHHSNIIPWQVLRTANGIELDWIEVTPEGKLDLESYKRILKEKGKHVKLVTFAHISNVLGTINPVKEITDLAHEAGALVHVDAAQSAARQKIDVKATGVDFLSFSSHKMYGPDGIGVLYGRRELLKGMDPWIVGGGMIRRVTKDEFEVDEVPWKFEAGTPNISDGAVFSVAVGFLEELGMDAIMAHERELMEYAITELTSLGWVDILGPTDADERLGALSFTVEGVHPHDLSTLLNEHGVAVRAGHHCAMPLHIKFKIPATTRISFAVYNTKADIDVAVEALKDSKKMFENM